MNKRFLSAMMLLMPLSMLAASLSKHTLKPNMIHLYKDPVQVEKWTEMLMKGEWYGRLRTHLFIDIWGEELQKNGTDIRKDSVIAGIGGSATFKSAYYHGFGATAGLYFTQGIGLLDREESYLYKSGKDTFSRYDRLKSGKRYIATFAEAYLEYRYKESDLKVGRQIFESFLIKSNDGKMIPNTFEGVSVISNEVPDTQIKVAYFLRQKLRDHATFHHLFAYGYSADDPYARFRENDDSGMHRGLTLQKLQERGIDDRLVVFEVENRSLSGLTLTGNYTAVAELLSSAMVQLDYRIDTGSWRWTPGIRYMQQFDNGAGEIGGASKKLLITGYKDPDSLDSWLLGIRLDGAYQAWKLRFAYTKVADKGDIIAPWRGFPTGGFTRLMGQYNWDANTKTYALKAAYDFKAFDLKVVGSFAYQDFDDDKAAVSADNHVTTLEFMYGFSVKQHTYWKLRYAHVRGSDDTPLPGAPGRYKLNPSYDEVRFEIDYLF